MSRRYVKTSKFNSLDQVTPEIVAVVSAKDNLQSIGNQEYFKRNYLEAIRQIVPKFYFNDEKLISGTYISFPNQLVNSHILANKHQATVFPVSGLTWDPYLSGIDTPSGFAKYFNKQYSPAQIATDDFERNILGPIGKSFKDYGTSQAFASYISGTFLPNIPMVCAGHHADENLATLTTSAFANDSSGTYKYLADNLGWVYFLNRLGPTNGFDPSTGLTTLLTNTLWEGRSVVLEDTINLYQEYLWKNQQWWTGVTDKIIPVDYASGLTTASGIYTSGTQLLDRLQTLNAVVYSPHYMDSPDTFVPDAFTTYLETSTSKVEGTLITATQEAGPLSRFLEALSFSISDRLTEDEEIGVLYDIGKCPEQFLELLGELIGWRFIGGDIDKWRVQLRNAVDIYKMKGTKRSIQYLIDTLFSTGVYNVTTSNTLNELWESYIPDLLYYSLATSSSALKDFDSYTNNRAKQFGVVNYSTESMDTNIKYIVDKILFDLVREFPDSFFVGGKPFPQMELVLSSGPNEGQLYEGPYHLMPTGTKDPKYPENPKYVYEWPVFMTGSKHDDKTSENLKLLYDPNFIFYYRDRAYLIPPYEKRQYYVPTRISDSMIDRIQYYLQCFGVDKSFAKQVTDYIRLNTFQSLEIFKVINNFMLYTKEKTYPPNYAVILKDVTKQRTPDPASLLSLWSGKSSHFLMNFAASSFDWATQSLAATSQYALNKVLRVMDQVIPAHAIPEVLLSVSDVGDAATALADTDCREIRPNFSDLYEGSGSVPTNFAVCAVNMGALAVANSIIPHRFKRTQVDSINDVLLSGSTFQGITTARRNSLRRRNFHNLLPETKMFTRLGRNNPGNFLLSSSYYSSGVGYLPLGFIPSSLKYKEVSLKQNPINQLGSLIDTINLHDVWDKCQNLNSPSSIFGYDISNTFPSRIKQSITTSDCNTYGRRGQLQEIMYVMDKMHDQEKYLQASSMVSGYMDSRGTINASWPSSSPLIIPMDFSAWYWVNSNVLGDINGLDVVKSIGNYLINKEKDDESLHYYEHFTLGRKVNELYNNYISTFSGHGTNSNYNLIGGPNFFSHTFGPLIYNSDFDIDGIGLETSGYLAASSPSYEVNISHFGGSGVLSLSGMKGLYGDVGTYAASNPQDLPLTYPEFRNNHLVSAIELVDTSTPTKFTQHPIFSIYDLTRDDQSKYSYAKYLINNQIIKYHRSVMSDSLPRLRVKIDSSNANNKARNFLQPDHEYEVAVKAHNLELSGAELGGLKLGCWIHTEPEGDRLWSYVRETDKWEGLKVKDVSGVDGIGIALRSAQYSSFLPGRLDSLIGSGEGQFKPYNVITRTEYDYRCVEPITTITTLEGSDPQAIANINLKSLNTLKFKFSTKNGRRNPPPDSYGRTIGKVHRQNQKYTFEFFVMKGDKEKFVVFEEISIKDITNYNKSVIQTKYGEAQLNASDLKAVLVFLKGLSKGTASRNSVVTSGIMEVSGGSRLNYRSNTAMYPYARTSGHNALISIDIVEG